MSCRASLHAMLNAHCADQPVARIAGSRARQTRALATNEARYRTRMLALCELDGDPFRRDHFDPGHFTASAFVLAPAGDALLLVHHRKLDRWLQPGGHIESSDADIVAAARREVLEETGIGELELRGAGTGAFDLDVHTIPALGAEPPHEHFDVRFLFAARSLAVRVSAESKAVRWVPLSEVESACSDESVLRAVRKLTGS